MCVCVCEGGEGRHVHVAMYKDREGTVYMGEPDN